MHVTAPLQQVVPQVYTSTSTQLGRVPGTWYLVPGIYQHMTHSSLLALICVLRTYHARLDRDSSTIVVRNKQLLVSVSHNLPVEPAKIRELVMLGSAS